MSDASEAKCPVLQSPHTATGSSANQHWWPNQLNLNILDQGSSQSNPMDDDFDYAAEFATLVYAALKDDLTALMTDSKEWWPADYAEGVQASLIGPITSIMGEIMLVAIAGEAASPMQLREVAEFEIRPRLLTLPGVAQVIPIGGEVKEYRVAPDPARMRQLEVTLDDVVRAVRGFAANGGGGFIDQRAQEFVIRTLGRERDAQALQGLVVAMRGGTPVLLGAVAEVGFQARPRRGSAGYEGKPAVVLGVQNSRASIPSR